MLKVCLWVLLVSYFISVAAAQVGSSSKSAVGDKKVVCYYTFWSHSRKAPYGFNPDRIDPFLCTHLIYAFADIGERNNLISSDPVFDFDERAYANITALKKVNPNLKVMLSIGGWKGGTIGFARISASETNRKEFAKNAVRFLRGYLFDGLDLNWQHPTFREGGKPEDKENYVLLAQVLREEFERDASDSGKARLLLSIAITHNQKFLPGYDLANFNIYMDFISVICYDYHFSFETVVNHHAPLYSVADLNGNENDAKVNTNYTINYFLEFVDAEKIIMGIPTFGRTYKLLDPEVTGLGSDSDGAGEKGPITGEKGFFAYFEICNYVKLGRWKVFQPKPGAVGPYATRDDQWVGYDDVQMIRNKASYAIDKGLGGVMFWTLDYDDFLGTCQGTKFPVIKAARNEIFKRTTFPEDGPDSKVIEETSENPEQFNPAKPAPLPVNTNEVGQPSTLEDKKVVCYYSYWSHLRMAPYGFYPNKIDPFLCTHLIYAFADIGDRNNLISSDPVFDFDERAYANLTALKNVNPNLKIMLSIGGWKGGTIGFARISATETNRTEFAQNAVRFLRAYSFDGLDLNWQHPTFREGGKPEDKENYVLLSQALREEFDRDAFDSGKPRLLLSIAITQSQNFLPGYDLANFNIYMDFISVICYDYHFSFETVVNHHTPLFSVADLNGNEKDANVNINYTINYFSELVDPEKLVMGIPLFGRTYTLLDPKLTALGSDADGAGGKGPITGERGYFAYFEICMLLKTGKWTVVQPKPGAVGPYAYKDDQWVGYDDIPMIKNKVNYAIEKGLGGVMFWTIDFDDFLGTCQSTKFPIIKAARNELFKTTTFPEDEPEPPVVMKDPETKPVSITPAKIPSTPSRTEGKKSTPGDKKVVCYYSYWSHLRMAPYGFYPNKIDPFLCTHLIYAFADIGKRNNLISSDPVFDFDERSYANLTALKNVNPNLKIMLSIGGWKGGTLGFALISLNDTNREEFTKNAVRYLRAYSFDGLDLNWQHPTFREGGRPEDRENYVLLAQALKEEFERDAADSGKPRLLLSIAITHNEKFLPGYDLANFNLYMDFISVICYDYHFSFETVVNHHAPLYSVADLNGNENDAKVNTNFTINYFLESVDPEKLVMGIPTFGRTYKLLSREETALGSDSDGAGDKGPITGEKGFFAYFEICMYVKSGKWTVVQPKPGAVGPYAYRGDQWVGYDDIQMIKNKAGYVNDKGLGGVMFWTLDYDDFLGTCQGTKFPIIKAARGELFKRTTFPEDAPEPPPKIAVTTTSRPTTSPQPPRLTPATPTRQTTAKRPVIPMLPKRPVKITPAKTPPAQNEDDIITHRKPEIPEITDPSPEPSNGEVAPTHIADELMKLIEKAGGLANLSKLLREDKSRTKTNYVPTDGYNGGETPGNSIVFKTSHLPPIMVALTNSSVFIREVNIYGNKS